MNVEEAWQQMVGPSAAPAESRHRGHHRAAESYSHGDAYGRRKRFLAHVASVYEPRGHDRRGGPVARVTRGHLTAVPGIRAFVRAETLTILLIATLP